MAWLAALAFAACASDPEVAATSDETPADSSTEAPQADAVSDSSGDGADTAQSEPDAVDSPGPDTTVNPDSEDTPEAREDTPEPPRDIADDARSDAEPEPVNPNVFDPEPYPESVWECDAGDEAWVRRALPIVFGRPAHGVREVALWTQVVGEVGRESALRAMTQSPEFVEQWRRVLMDALFISRQGDKSHYECFGEGLREPDEGELAAFLRDREPLEVGIGQFNMTDLLRSALRLDDLSVVYRAQLFAMMEKPVTGGNATPANLDLTRRTDFNEVFQKVWIGRDLDCVGCHNGTWSITGHPEPELDRTWEVPGHFEAALFGFAEGRPALEVASMFRHLSVVAPSTFAHRPWGWAPACGAFSGEEALQTDINAVNAYFIQEYGEAGTVWAMERNLRAGFDSLRVDGLDLDLESLEVSGTEAFAYLSSLALANAVWGEVYGYPLTIAHGFPRNRAQRDTLWGLTESYISEGFSLFALLRESLLDPRFNPLPPEAGCGDDGGYYLRPVFDPWSVEEDVETLQGNGPGDQVIRREATNLMRGASSALGWVDMPEFVEMGAVSDLWVGIGKQTRDAEPGFRSVDFQGLLLWESRYGDCSKGGALGMVEPDYIEEVVGLIQASQALDPWADASVRDAVLWLKDRLLAAPVLVPGEADLLASLTKLDLDAAASKQPTLEMALRRVCGVLLSSPAYMLESTTPPEYLGAPPAALVLPAHTTPSLCADVAPLLEAIGHAAQCSDEGLLFPGD